MSPFQLSKNSAVYTGQVIVPMILSKTCQRQIVTIFNYMNEEQKRVVDIWISKNINNPLINPSLMQSIETYKKIRLNEQYKRFKDKQHSAGIYSSNDLSEVASKTWEQSKWTLFYIILIVVSLVCVRFV